MDGTDFKPVYNAVMCDLECSTKLIDPMIFTLNRNKFWSRYMRGDQALCNGMTKIDKNYWKEGITYQNPNSLSYNEIKTISLKISGAMIEFK